jgi:ankyrin repeat protein
MFGKRPAKYRFTVGTRVKCNVGTWKAGVIVAMDYHEEGRMAPGQTVPYQVQLDDGRLIFVPADVDQLCQKLLPPWWASAFKESSGYYAEKNPDAASLVKAIAGNLVDAKDHEGNTALMEAVKKTWPNAVSQLISMKADVNIADTSKSRPIHFAAAGGKGILKLLVDARADLNCQDEDPDYDPEFTSTTFGDRLEHRAPLHYACSAGDTAAAKLLLEAKANANIQDAQWQTPLHLAIDAEHEDCIDLLLSSGADTSLGNQSSGLDNSPLMDAAAAGKTELVKKLIASKADINKTGKQDMSALHLAARSRRAAVAEILIGARADVNLKSKVGTALELARKNGGVDLLKVFGVQSENSMNIGNISSLDAAQRKALFLE